MKFPHPNRRRAFTLVEVMVAIIIFGMVIAAIYSTWAVLMRATQVSNEAATRAQYERIALRSIEDSLMCVQSFQASHKYYTFLVANGQEPELSFVARVPDIFPRNGKFGDFNQRRLTYSLENGENGEKDLVLRQNPILMDLDEDEKKYPLVLVRNVKNFAVECWDTNKFDWIDEWDNTNAIPVMLRVNLVLGSQPANGRTAPDLALTRDIAMPSAIMPAALQGGLRGGAPGGPGAPGGEANPVQIPLPK